MRAGGGPCHSPPPASREVVARSARDGARPAQATGQLDKRRPNGQGADSRRAGASCIRGRARERRRVMSSTSQRAGRRPEPYIPDMGRAVVKPRLEGKGTVINLSLNESSYGASPRAVAAAQERCGRLNRYPDVASTELRKAIGAHFGLDPDRIVCGNGSEELIDVIARLYARTGDEILFTEFGFIQFPIVTMRVGATAVKAPAPNQ